MGFRLFRRIKILPGITLNLSKSGVSVSAGVRGAHVTVGSKGVRQTVGLPGSGIFYTQYEKHGSKPASNSPSTASDNQVEGSNNVLLILFLLAVIGISAAIAFGINIIWPVLIIAAVLYFAGKKGAGTEKTTMPDPREGLDKRFFTASGEAKFSEPEVAAIVESAQAMVLLVTKSLTIANESTDYETRMANTKTAKDTMATLQKYTELYPGIDLANLDEVKHSVEMIEQETRGMSKES